MADKAPQSQGNSDGPLGEQAAQPEFIIQRLYVKNASFEAPNTPTVFQEKWEPRVHLDLNNQSQPLAQDMYEVILRITVTVKLGEKTAFIVEIEQAGVFIIRGFAEEPLKQVLGSFCLNILFPYIRERISNLIEHGGFPALYLAPLNFDALYQERIKSQEQQQQQAGGSDTIQ